MLDRAIEYVPILAFHFMTHEKSSQNGAQRGASGYVSISQKDFHFNNQFRHTGAHQLGISPANTMVVSDKNVDLHSWVPNTNKTCKNPCFPLPLNCGAQGQWSGDSY